MIREREGRGRGLVAARNIKTGDVILQDNPVITIAGEADTWEAGQQIREQVGKMREEERREFYRLTRMQKLLDISESFLSAAGDDQDHRAKAELVSLYKEETAIFFNNDISSGGGSKSLYLSLALLNHSCQANSCWGGAGEGRALELRAVREVREGEELTVNYISVEGRYSDSQERRDRLRQGWDFLCDCRLCRTGEEDDTKLEVRRIQADMRDLCDVALEQIDWAQLTSLQHRLVGLVETLSSAPLLLPRECQSLANLAQLARYRRNDDYCCLNPTSLLLLIISTLGYGSSLYSQETDK